MTKAKETKAKKAEPEPHTGPKYLDDTYHPNKTTMRPDVLQAFLSAKLTGDLSEVPGMGKVSIEHLQSGEPDGEYVMNTFQVVGKFLMFKQNKQDGTEVSIKEHCDRFYQWLKYKGVRTRPHTVTHAIAELVNSHYPGVYDPNAFEEVKQHKPSEPEAATPAEKPQKAEY